MEIITTTYKSFDNFYLINNEEKYFIFSQRHHKGVNEYFKNGVKLNNLFNYKKPNDDYCILHTLDKLPTYLKYLEKEYHLEILTKKRTIKNLNKERGFKYEL